MSRNRNSRKKSKKKDKTKRISVPTKILEKMRAVARLQGLEQWAKSTETSREAEGRFQAHMMFSLNAIVEALVTKGVLTLEELNEARLKVIADYKKEEAERAAAEEQAKKEAETKTEGKSEEPSDSDPQTQETEPSEPAENTPESPSEVSEGLSAPLEVAEEQSTPSEAPEAL